MDQEPQFTPRSEQELDDIIQDIYTSVLYDMASDQAPSAVKASADAAPQPQSQPQPAVRDLRHDAGPKRRRAPAEKPKKKKKRRARRRGWPAAIGAGVLLAAFLYWLVVFSPVPFIKKWRDIYIETAMGTMTHQWLATSFIPEEGIDTVMEIRQSIEERQEEISTNWSLSGLLSGAGEKEVWSELRDDFFDLYPEIDRDSFEAYMSTHRASDDVDENGYLRIDQAGIGDKPTGIYTTNGDQVLAIDTLNGIVIVKVTGEDYVGRLAIVKDPAQMGLGLARNLGESGSVIATIAKDENAILAVNASGFADEEGHGTGGVTHGLVIKDGKTYNDYVGGNYKTIGFDYDNVLQIGKYKDSSKLKNAVEFKPVLVLDGEAVISGSAGWGIQPRSAIGQRTDGQVLILVVDGRQPGYSIGCTMGDLADVMTRYGAYQACNLDGGSSSILYYNGRKITRPSAADKDNGRRLPNAFVVYER